MRLEGAASGTAVDRNWFPELGDSALYVPQLTVDALAALAASNGLEVGVRGSYADFSWAQRSATGTMPIPQRPALWGIGPEAHVMIRLNERFALGFGGNLLSYSIPVARWHLDMSCTPSATCIEETTTAGLARYDYVGTKRESFLVANLAFYPSFALAENGKYGHLFFGPSAHEGFRNEGFTNFVSDASGSTLERSGFVWFLGAGYGVEIEGLRLSAMFSLPITRDEAAVAYDFAAFATVGTAIALWGGASD